MLPKAAVSFTGGKDCHLAWHRCKLEYEIVCLVAFHPPSKNFQAHPLDWQHLQAAAAGIPLRLYCIDPAVENEDYYQAYANALRQLQEDTGVTAIISGDMDLVGTMPHNFLTEVCWRHVTNFKVVLPLWQANRDEVMEEILGNNNSNNDDNAAATWKVVFSCVKSPHFDSQWIGRTLDRNALEELRQCQGLDLTGEKGEYHTMVLDGPMYQARRIEFSAPTIASKELTEQRGQTDGERWWVCDLEKTKLRLVEK